MKTHTREELTAMSKEELIEMILKMQDDTDDM